jgi:PST family polysaccharide transporter/antigen flippase
VTGSLGLAQTGIWQASIRLSGAILGFYTVYLATSYMPRLSALSGKAAVSLVLRSLLTVGGAFATGAVAIYLLRAQIVPLLFSDAFASLQPLLAWQLLGDLFRVCAYVIGFCVVAKARLGLHIAAEGVQYSLYVAITLTVVLSGGSLADVIRAYTLSYGVYFLLALAGLAFFRVRMR